MKSKKETFASLMESFRHKYNRSVVFEDFLTMALCALTRNPGTGLSHYEDLYLKTIEKYATDELRFQFPKLLDALVNEMEERVDSGDGNDVLGEYYELNHAKKVHSQFFTPWCICKFMAKTTIGETDRTEGKPIRILEPACGSGRFIIAAAKEAGPDNEFYGIDLDLTCVKMAALNVFLNGVFNTEVMCANFLLPDDFQVSYFISFLPLGIFKIEKKEDSRLWHILRNTLEANRKEKENKQKEEREKKQAVIKDLKLPSESDDGSFEKKVTQTSMF